MPRYEGTPQGSAWERLQKRRALNDALMDQAMRPYEGTQMVSGHAVDDRWGQGIGRLGTALIGALGNRQAKKEEEVLSKEYETGREGAVNKISDLLSPQPSNYVEKNPSMTEPDYLGAGIEAETNPYLKDSGLGRALVARAIGGQSSKYPSYQFLPTGEGYAKGNRRTGEITDPTGVIRSQDDPRLQGQIAGARGYAGEAAKNQAALATKPPVVTATEQAEKDVALQMNPQIAADTESAKLTAKAETGREQTAVGINQAIAEARAIFAGDTPPTASGIGKFVDRVSRWFGKSAKGAAEAAQLEVVGGLLMSKTPRFEGPQGVRDVEIYQEMSGKVGDRGIPMKERKDALDVVQRLLGQYEKLEGAQIPGLTPEEGAEWQELEAEFGGQ